MINKNFQSSTKNSVSRQINNSARSPRKRIDSEKKTYSNSRTKVREERQIIEYEKKNLFDSILR